MRGALWFVLLFAVNLHTLSAMNRFGALFPGSSSILKIADEFLLLGIRADDRAVGGLKLLFLSLDVLKLRVLVRVSCASLLLLDVDAQRVAELS